MRRLPSGTLSMRATTPATPTVCSWSGPGVSMLRVLGAEHDQHAVAGQRVVDELDRALLADRQRRQRVRVGDRVAQRQDRQPVRQPGGGSYVAAHRSVPRMGTERGCAGSHERQLDGEDPVLVGGGGRVRVHVGAERHDAAERAVLDLQLLVDAVVAALGVPLAGEDELAPADLQLDLVGVDPREVGAHHRARRVATRSRRRPRARSRRGGAGDRPRSRTSPNSSSISRRIRSKLAKRSRSWAIAARCYLKGSDPLTCARAEGVRPL